MLPRLTILALLALLPASAARADFTFIHASDNHFGAGENDKLNAAMFDEIAKLSPGPPSSSAPATSASTAPTRSTRSTSRPSSAWPT
jgi:hypothetical protein